MTGSKDASCAVIIRPVWLSAVLAGATCLVPMSTWATPTDEAAPTGVASTEVTSTGATPASAATAETASTTKRDNTGTDDIVSLTSLTLTQQDPAIGCLAIPEGFRSDIEKGSRRLLVSFLSFIPSDSGSAAFELSTVINHAGDHELLHVFAIHPVQAFNVETGVEPHRFLFSVASHSHFFDLGEYCFRLGFADRESENGRAVVSVDWSDSL